jgi:hypothetical protein
MAQLKVHEVLRKRALITRESAAPIRDALLRRAATEDVVLDFAGIQAVTPSFVDEILAAVEEALATASRRDIKVTFLNPPTRLSSKFAAIGRARHLEVVEANGAWVISGPPRAVS